MKLFIDIETINVRKPELIDHIKSTVKPPGTIKKPESITKWWDEKADSAGDALVGKTGLNPLYGEIIVIGYALDGEQVESISRHNNESEKSLLIRFWEELDYICRNNKFPEWIAHNAEFDLRFLWLRSVINEVQPSIKIPFDAKPWNKAITDTLYTVMGNNKAGGSLNNIAMALGLGSKTEGMDGSKVNQAYIDGRISEIAEYCRQDVHLCREIYKRIYFIDKIE